MSSMNDNEEEALKWKEIGHHLEPLNAKRNAIQALRTSITAVEADIEAEVDELAIKQSEYVDRGILLESKPRTRNAKVELQETVDVLLDVNFQQRTLTARRDVELGRGVCATMMEFFADDYEKSIRRAADAYFEAGSSTDVNVLRQEIEKFKKRMDEGWAGVEEEKLDLENLKERLGGIRNGQGGQGN